MNKRKSSEKRAIQYTLEIDPLFEFNKQKVVQMMSSVSSDIEDAMKSFKFKNHTPCLE